MTTDDHIRHQLLTVDDIAELYRCTRRHARDVTTKLVGFPAVAPGSTARKPLWLRQDVENYLRRKPATQSPES